MDGEVAVFKAEVLVILREEPRDICQLGNKNLHWEHSLFQSVLHLILRIAKHEQVVAGGVSMEVTEEVYVSTLQCFPHH